MGTQCNIILTYYTERWNEEDEIKQYLEIPKESKFETTIDAVGNRNWGIGDMQCHIICMKDWDEKKCEEFIEFLKSVNWHFPNTVQIYYVPASFENYELFKLRSLNT